MYTSPQRIRELRERFSVTNGQFFAEMRFKNLNWYFTNGNTVNRNEPGEWFCYGDIRDEDVARLMKELKDGELLVLGWKDRQADAYKNRDGEPAIAIANAGVVYDVRRDGPIKEPNQ
jgi:hypothetical protein